MRPPGFGEIGEALRRVTVEVRAGRQSGGSGVIWDASGLIVTNAHVAHARDLKVTLWDGREFPAAIAATDARRDLASLRIRAGSLTAAQIGDSATLRVGELVIAVGNPLGFTGALTTGIVHALGPVGGLGARGWVQADVRLAPGNSGGPLADASGRVIGINTMVLSNGLALAIPGNTAAEFVRHGPSPNLGVTIRPVQTTADGVGLLVLEVSPASAAERASLLVGDLLVSGNGESFRSADDLARVIDSSAGGLLTLRFLRGDRRRGREVAVRLNALETGAAA
jgi:serine protease Do